MFTITAKTTVDGVTNSCEWDGPQTYHAAAELVDLLEKVILRYAPTKYVINARDREGHIVYTAEM